MPDPPDNPQFKDPADPMNQENRTERNEGPVLDIAMMFDQDGNQVWPPPEKLDRPGEIVAIAKGEYYKPLPPKR